MNITVYLGANEGNDPSLRKAVRELGTWIGESGNRLVYGGSKSGLMGEIAESVLQAGGEVTGVEPQFFIDMEYQYDAITELIVTKDMTERKTKMIELGDVFIAFPGGTGTLEEIAEVMSKVSLKHLEAPCILYNLNGYYDSLKALLSHMTELGLSSPERQEGIYFARDLSEIRKIIENQRSNATITPPEPGASMDLATGTIPPATTFDRPDKMGINGFLAQYIMLPLETSEPMSLTLEVMANGESASRIYTVDVPVPDGTLKAGNSYLFSAIIDGNTVTFSSVNVKNWTEVDETGNPLYPTLE